MRHYSVRTEEAYVGWIKRFIFFHGKASPPRDGRRRLRSFCRHWSQRACERIDADQALCALLFLYREVLSGDNGWLDDVVRAKRPRRLPVILTRQEVKTLLGGLQDVNLIMASLLYGAGLRLLECLRLRVKALTSAPNQIVVAGGKGEKDRLTMLPAICQAPLISHLERVRTLYQQDLERGFGRVYWPDALRLEVPQRGERVGLASGPFQRQGSAWIRGPGSGGGIMWTNRSCREPSKRPEKVGMVKPVSCHTPRHASRHTPAGRRLRHPDDSGTARASGRQHDNDLYHVLNRAAKGSTVHRSLLIAAQDVAVLGLQGVRLQDSAA